MSGERRRGVRRRSKKMSVSLPPDLVEWVDGHVKRGIFASRSHAVRVAILWLKKYMDEHGGQAPPL